MDEALFWIDILTGINLFYWLINLVCCLSALLYLFCVSLVFVLSVNSSVTVSVCL